MIEAVMCKADAAVLTIEPFLTVRSFLLINMVVANAAVQARDAEFSS